MQYFYTKRPKVVYHRAITVLHLDKYLSSKNVVFNYLCGYN